MITINFETIEERLEDLKRSRSQIRYVVGKPILTTTVKKNLPEDDKTMIVAREINNTIVQRVKEENKSDLEKQLLIEEDAIRVERNKLSSQTWKMVENGATQAELAAHYAQIESHRPALIDLYDKRQYVKKYGCLPTPPEPEQENLDPYYLKDQKKKLVDKRCKLKAKLKESAKASKPAKILEWEMELAQADVEYNAVVDKLKQIEGKA